VNDGRPPRCPICDSGEWRVVFEHLHDRQFDLEGEFSLWSCGSCGVRRLWPVPEDLALFYPDVYGPHSQLEGLGPRRPWHPMAWRLSFSGNPVARRMARSRIGGNEAARELWTYLDSPPRSVLDYGCGGGRFLARMDQIGVPAVGTDISPQAVERALGLGLTCFVGSYENLPAGLGEFDVVRLWHVLEHVASPVEALAALRPHVAAGGRLVVGVPNAASAVAELFGSDWYALDAPRHLWGFDEQTLRRAFEGAGFVVERVLHNGDGNSVYQSIRYALESGGSRATLAQPPDPRLVRALDALAGEWNQQQAGDAIVMIGSVHP
jgi:SAM-dependent methyltransferase